jgi:hypothetical protein
MKNMKKLFLTLLTAAAIVTAQAADYQYLTFEMTDGTKASVEAANLSLTFDGTTLKVGTETFVLTNLAKMYFSTNNQTTGISQIENGELKIDNFTEIFDLKGNKVSKDQMRKGIYIVKTKNGTAKLTVK